MSLKSQAHCGRTLVGRSAPNACPDRLLDVAQAAAILGLKSPRTLYKWAYAGRIPSIRIGRLLRFRHADLAHLIANGERAAFAAPDVFPPPAALLRR